MKFIYGDLFAGISDFIYSIPSEHDNCHHPNTFDVAAVEAFDGIPIIFTLTSFIHSFFPVMEKVNKEVVLITHCSDWNIGEEFYSKLPKNVIHWFCPNIMIRKDRWESIPFGLENLHRFSFHHIYKIDRMLAKIKEEKTYKNLVYLCYSITTNSKERETPYKLLAGKPFVTTVRNPNIFDFDGYIDNVYRHKFVISPEGSGIDCHRTWESLYMDTIPVLKRHVNLSYYEDLPICLVNQWDEITEEFLNKEYERIMSSEWNLDKLYFEWWEQRVKSFTI
jgi:hypothetical protein